MWVDQNSYVLIPLMVYTRKKGHMEKGRRVAYGNWGEGVTESSGKCSYRGRVSGVEGE